MSTLELRVRELESAPNLIKVIHYACESWFDVKDRPVQVGCIAIVDHLTRAETVFSLTDTQENAERYLLDCYYKYLKENQDCRFVHWNMNGADFGFDAIDKRFHYVNGGPPPHTVPQERRFDLDDLVRWRYGKEFAAHPKLTNLAVLNGHNKRYMLSGKDEAEKFAKGQHGDIKRSVIEKASLISYLLSRFIDGSLETLNSGPLVTFASSKLDSVRTVLAVATRFRDVERQLARRHGGRQTLEVKDEYDAQDLFHSLLRLFFGDVRTEEWTPKYAGGNKRMDFLLPTHNLAIELKHSRASMTTKELGDELVVDIANYREHQNVRHLVCIVFDSAGHIANPRGIEADLTGVRDGFRTTTAILDR